MPGQRRVWRRLIDKLENRLFTQPRSGYTVFVIGALLLIATNQMRNAILLELPDFTQAGMALIQVARGG